MQSKNLIFLFNVFSISEIILAPLFYEDFIARELKIFEGTLTILWNQIRIRGLKARERFKSAVRGII